MSEYITLPSNVVYEGNTIAEYRTVLPSGKNLKGHWKVGLARISFTKSWFNIKHDSPISLVDSRGNIYLSPEPVQAGFYETEKQISEAIDYSVSAIQTELANENITFNYFPRAHFNPRSRRVSLSSGCTSDNRDMYLSIGEELERMLGVTRDDSLYKVEGINDTTVVIQQKDIKGTQEAMANYDLKCGIHNLFIYCNLVEPVTVGNSYRQLLATVGISNKAKFGDQCEERYDNPFYVPLATNNFQNIDIAIFDDNGQLIPFKFGRVIVTLHLIKDVRTSN